MSGFICKREVVLNAPLVVRLYGWRVLFVCLFARKGTTFLSIVVTYHKG